MLDELTDERRYNRLSELVGRARGLPPAAQREFITAECADNPPLASEAYEILREETGAKFGKPLVWLRSDLQPGDILGDRYVITGVLGGGAQGRVYEAEDHRLGKRLAVKQMLGSDGVSRRLFEREARLLGQLRNVAPARVAGSLPNVTDFVTDLNSLFIVMEYVPGATLAELIAAPVRQYSSADVVGWGDRVLEVLEFLHGRRPDPVIHRDVKPANLKLTPDGQLVLLDFGLTKGAIAEVSRLGRGGTSVAAYGTTQYAPWEQVKDGRTDERGDVFSTGATLYRLLTATDFPNALERKEALADGRPDPLRPVCELNPAVSEGLSEVLGRAMSLKAGERYASAADMRRAWLSAAGSSTGSAADIDEVTFARGRDFGGDADTSLDAAPTDGRPSSLLSKSEGRLRARVPVVITALNIVMLPALVLLLCLWMVAAPLYALVLFPAAVLSALFSVAAVKNRLLGRRVLLLRGLRALLLCPLVLTGYMPLSQSIERLVSRVSPPIAYKLLDPFNAHATSLLRRTLGPSVERFMTGRAGAAAALLFGTLLLVMLAAYEVSLSARGDSARASLWKALFIEPWEAVRRPAGGHGDRR
jgi:serine/threonine protein kinase